MARKPTFVDVFAGCGGLSLGLKRAGWKGLFAIEKDEFAFSTLSTNFRARRGALSYNWPESIERKPWDVKALLSDRSDALAMLAGKVDLLAGGPPCQGFSHAGRRRLDDPRNSLFEAYLSLVAVIKPRLVLIENVQGFTSTFQPDADGESRNFAEALRQRLSADYYTTSEIIRACDYGVPQMRPRFFLVGARKDGNRADLLQSFFNRLKGQSKPFLAKKGLRSTPTAKDALSDLEIRRNGTKPCPDTPGFEAISYICPITQFQKVMRDGSQTQPTDTRIARHRPDIEQRFSSIIATCREDGRLRTAISPELRTLYGIKKVALRVLDPLAPAPTITSLPDDLLHYSEPRTLTVRENARLQTFPDWFVFRGKYTTGGALRRQEVPRFTQVANAVPPLLAEQIGAALLQTLTGG